MIEDDEILEPLTIEELADVLQEEYGLSAEVRQVRKNLKMLFVMTDEPWRVRKTLKDDIGPDLDIDFVQPRKTKSTGFMLQGLQEGAEEAILVKIVKGGIHQRGRKNEVSFQKYIKDQIKNDGECKLTVKDNYGKEIYLDIVGVKDTALQHGKLNRADTTLTLSDGSIFGIS